MLIIKGNKVKSIELKDKKQILEYLSNKSVILFSKREVPELLEIDKFKLRWHTAQSDGVIGIKTDNDKYSEYLYTPECCGKILYRINKGVGFTKKNKKFPEEINYMEIFIDFLKQ